MRQLLTLLALATGCVGLACAESFSGTLLDATCYAQQQSQPNQQTNMQSCAPTSSTSSFAISVSGKVYTLDSDGNTKAAEAMKSRADRSANPNSPTTSAAIAATVTGKKEGDTIKVETINVQ